MRLRILSSHPIQYQAPWFRALAKQVDLHVYFAHQPSEYEQGEGFGKPFAWDQDLLSGYTNTILKNISKKANVSSYGGCDTPEIHRVIQESSFDTFLVMGWYLKCYRQAIRACRLSGTPVLVRGDSQLGTPRSLLKRLAMELRQRWLLRQFDGFLSVGKRHTEYLRHFGVPTRKITFAPHFVDNDWFREKVNLQRLRRAVIRKKMGIPEDAFVPIFVGKFQTIKRPLDLLNGVKRFQESFGTDGSKKKVVVLFVGSGELEAELREEASKLQVAAVFAGFKNQCELPECYAAADVLVLPSLSETWGLVVNEGMACGLPAVVSGSIGCAPDLIEEARTGFIFPMGDVTALANRLARVAELKHQGYDWEPALTEKMRTYSIDCAVAGTLEAISQFKQSST